ncbi:hypothetical protein Pint_31461 [Pistacia integerrima]|uniref:Uncharacterized protein n=1 Tax=Pistacia integerrima TaxID=434235 RepID=A0ACC0XLJ6_9ROSI|nr:hypothetical protein Pint_31461 [Pistacia integerrima]
MEKYDSRILKTCMLGEKMIVFCGPSGNKFLFNNLNKLVATWWLDVVRKLIRFCLITLVGDEAKLMRMLMSFLNPNALVKYIERINLVTKQHVLTHWEGKREIKVHLVAKFYTFELACSLFISIDDLREMSKLAEHFNVRIKGVIDLLVHVSGTRFYKGNESYECHKGRSEIDCETNKNGIGRYNCVT